MAPPWPTWSPRECSTPRSPGWPAGPLPLDRPLYRHQEQAIRKITAGRNVIVATGTGSGKTESFLLPILNALSAEHAARDAGPRGSRPAAVPDECSGQRPDQAAAGRHSPLRRTSRSAGTSGATPRDRPGGGGEVCRAEPGPAADCPTSCSAGRRCATHRRTSCSPTTPCWSTCCCAQPTSTCSKARTAGTGSFIAVDEAHVYDGAKAAELAMLLRRLRDRVAGGRSLRCIATSATVGDDPRAVTEFAQRLFDADFEWVPGDTSRQDLVGATRRAMPEGPFWGPLAPASYLFIAHSADPEAEVLRLAEAAGVAGYADAATALAHERRIADSAGPAGRTPAPVHRPGRPNCSTRDIDRTEAAGSRPGHRRRPGARQLDGSAVLSARYHLFARASEGAYTCLSKAGPHVSLARQGNVRHLLGCHVRVRRLQALRCRVPVRIPCGTRRTGWSSVPGSCPPNAGPGCSLGDAPVVVDEDDETLEEPGRTLDTDDGVLCAGCGSLSTAGTTGCTHGGCGGALLWPVRRLHTKADTVSGCLCCGARGAAMVRQFETGGDAAASVHHDRALPGAAARRGRGGRSARGRPQAAPVQRQPAGSRLLRALSGNQLRDHPAPAADPRRPVQRAPPTMRPLTWMTSRSTWCARRTGRTSSNAVVPGRSVSGRPPCG